MRRLAAAFLEERANKEWIDDNSKACPGCTVRIEKSQGCNHMTCRRCGGHFCFRCGEKLFAANPYAHFQQKGPCFQKLFDRDPNEDVWVGPEMDEGVEEVEEEET